MTAKQSFSTNCLLSSPELGVSRDKRERSAVSTSQRPIKPLELDAIGPQAHWSHEIHPRGFTRRLFSPLPQWSVIHVCTRQLKVPPEEQILLHHREPGMPKQIGKEEAIKSSSSPSQKEPSSSPFRGKNPSKVFKLESLVADHLCTEDQIRKQIEKGANGGIQVMQWRFMRNARMTTAAFLKAIDEISNAESVYHLKKMNIRDEEMDVHIISRSGIASMESLPLDDPRRIITPDTVSACSFFRLFDIIKVGPWKIASELGSGSTSRVKLAIHELTGVKAAIKIIPREIRESFITSEIITAQRALDKAYEDEMKAAGKQPPGKHKAAPEPRAVRDTRIHREISMLRVLTGSHHPSILKLKDAVWGERLVLLVLDYVPGGSLLSRLTSSKGRFSEDEARPIFRSLLTGVAFLHSAGIVHRDLKIENILLDAQEKQSFIIDFGLANFFYSMALELPTSRPQINGNHCLPVVDNDVAPRLSQSRSWVSSPEAGTSFHLLDTFCGSLYYAAPELLAGHAYPGPAVDIWSLGVILFAMIAGKVPFDVPGDRVSALHAQIMKGQPCSALPEGTSPTLINLISKMLRVDHKIRSTARELLMDDSWVLASSTSGLICTGLAFIPHPSNQPRWGPKIPLSKKHCCRGRKIDFEYEVLHQASTTANSKLRVSHEQNHSLPNDGTSSDIDFFKASFFDDKSVANSSHSFSEQCCPCCLVLKRNQYRALDEDLWLKLNLSLDSSHTESAASIAIEELESLLAFQYPQPLLRAIIESFFKNSKRISPCSPMCPWPLVSLFLLVILRDENQELPIFKEKNLWNIFFGIPPPKPPIKLLEDCREEILAELRPRAQKSIDVAPHSIIETVSSYNLRTIYLRGLFKVEFLPGCSWYSQSEMLDRLALSLGHLPGVIGGVVPVSISKFTHGDAVKLRSTSFYHPSYCKYIVTLQIPPDDRWKEAKELSIRSVSGKPLQIFPMMSMSVELVRVFWSQSYGLIFQHFSGSMETFYQIKMLIHSLVEKGEAPASGPVMGFLH